MDLSSYLVLNKTMAVLLLARRFLKLQTTGASGLLFCRHPVCPLLLEFLLYSLSEKKMAPPSDNDCSGCTQSSSHLALSPIVPAARSLGRGSGFDRVRAAARPAAQLAGRPAATDWATA